MHTLSIDSIESAQADTKSYQSASISAHILNDVTVNIDAIQNNGC